MLRSACCRPVRPLSGRADRRWRRRISAGSSPRQRPPRCNLRAFGTRQSLGGWWYRWLLVNCQGHRGTVVPRKRPCQRHGGSWSGSARTVVLSENWRQGTGPPPSITTGRSGRSDEPFLPRSRCLVSIPCGRVGAIPLLPLRCRAPDDHELRCAASKSHWRAPDAQRRGAAHAALPALPALPRSPPHPEFPRADSRPGAPPTTRDERSRTPDVRGARAEPASRSGTARPPARGLGAGEADC